ncbi:sensor histidine kinase [Agromyces sp. NPDC056379]|uniref:sensor histidine kinase n=1 Tax=unclassified Agromyces TaxID=2639701 RepID=UPI0035DADA3D
MTLGLPGHLARDSLSRALANAGHAAAFTCLGIGVVLGTVMATIGGQPDRWSGVVLLIIMIALLALVSRYPTVTLTVLYLVAGAAIVLAITIMVMADGEFSTTNNAVLALPSTALLLVGGAGSGSAIALTWATLGFALSEAAAFLGVVMAGGAYSPNVAVCFAFGVVVIVRVFDGLTRRSDMRRDTGLHRASQQTRELAIRHDYELRATARLHDTALSHLVAIAAAGSGQVDERLRVGIRQDLGLIVGRDWAIDHALSNDAAAGAAGVAVRGTSTLRSFAPSSASPTASSSASSRNGRQNGWRTRARPNGAASDPRAPIEETVPSLSHAFSAAANAGLEVRVTGDFAVLGTLGPRRVAALDAAVAQCLINVARHAGVELAELALGLGGGEVTVAVMDSGVGFDESEVPPDRIGLRTSIRARIEQEQGTVRLWSTKGIGTTIVLTVPEGGE